MLESFFNFSASLWGSCTLICSMYFFIILVMRETCGVRTSVKWHILYGVYRIGIHMPLMMMAAESAFRGELWPNVLFYISYFVGVAFGYPYMMNYVYNGKLCKVFFIGFLAEFIAGIIPIILYTLVYSGAKLLHIPIADALMAICLMLLMMGVTYAGTCFFRPYLQKVRKYEMNNVLTWAMFVYGVGHSIIDNCRMVIVDSYNAFVVTAGVGAFFQLGLVFVIFTFIVVVLTFLFLRKRFQLLQMTRDNMLNWYEDVMNNGIKMEAIELDMETVLREVMSKSSASGRKKSLKNYCERLQASYEKMKGNLYCRDYMVDATLADDVRKCQACGIDTEIHFQAYNRGEVNELTICYILTQCFEAVMEAASKTEKGAANVNVDLKASNVKGMPVLEMVYEQKDGQKIGKRPFRQLERQLENTVLRKNGLIKVKRRKEKVEVFISIMAY